MSNPSSSGCGGRTTLESHQGVILYLSVFAAKSHKYTLSHKEELANHPDPPDPVQSAAEEHRLVKSLTKSTQKKQKRTLITILDALISIQFRRSIESKYHQQNWELSLVLLKDKTKSTLIKKGQISSKNMIWAPCFWDFPAAANTKKWCFPTQ